MHISKALLKNEIDELDEDYLELVYNILRQFPHRLMDAERRQESVRTPFQGSVMGEAVNIRQFAGAWADMDDTVFAEWDAEWRERRRQAFSGRNLR